MGGLDRLLLTWLGNSQELRYCTAGHLAITKGTHHQHSIKGSCVWGGGWWWGGMSSMWPQTILEDGIHGRAWGGSRMATCSWGIWQVWHSFLVWSDPGMEGSERGLMGTQQRSQQRNRGLSVRGSSLTAGQGRWKLDKRRGTQEGGLSQEVCLGVLG